jgi:hypothetical protein
LAAILGHTTRENPITPAVNQQSQHNASGNEEKPNDSDPHELMGTTFPIHFMHPLRIYFITPIRHLVGNVPAFSRGVD